MQFSPEPSAQTTAQQRDALKAWMRQRLVGEAMCSDWSRLLETSWNELLGLQIQEVFPREAWLALIESYLRPDRLADLLRPAIRLALPAIVAQLRADTQPVGRWVPQDAKVALRALASEKGLVHEDWVRALFQQEAIEAVMSDALYRGIRDFSTILPRIFLSLLPTNRLPGLGGAGAVGKRVLDELERRIEPEIKTFLSGGTQRALARAAEFAIHHMEEASYVALRKNMIDFALSKSSSFHVQPVTDDRLKSIEPIVESITQHAASGEEFRRIARQLFESIASQLEGRTVREGLEQVGVTQTPDFEAWGAASWPALQLLFAGPTVSDWCDAIVDELLQEQSRLQNCYSP